MSDNANPQDKTAYAHNMSHIQDMLIILSLLSLNTFCVKYYVSYRSQFSHLSFQLYVIERMIFETLSNLLEFPFDYIL